MEKSESRPTILALESIEECDIDLTGPKALGIAKLMKLGLPVPGGFCVTTEACGRHLEKCRTAELLASLSGHDIHETLGRIRDRIINEPLEREVEAGIRDRFDALGSPLVAVRSSAVREDQSARSFAGLYDTFLGIGSAELCMERVRKCWASLYTERVFRYLDSVACSEMSLMAVIVQRLVRADSSGVMFSGAAADGGDERVVIESCFGLGEALVSGRVAPDRFVVLKRNLEIVEKHISNKSIVISAGPDGAKELHRLSPPLSTKASLDAGTVVKLCRLAFKADSLFSGGKDIEWAIEGGSISFLQCRPVTAGFDGAAPIRIFSSANLGEVFPDPVTPLTRSIAVKLMALPFLESLRRLGVDFGEPEIISVIDGRFYYEITALRSVMDSLPGNQADSIGAIMGGHQEKLVGRILARIGRKRIKPVIDIPRLLVNYPRMLLTMMTSAARRVDRVIEELNSLSRKVAGENPDSLSGSQILGLLEHIDIAMRNSVPDGAAAVSGGLPGFQGLRAVCRKWLDDMDGSLANRLLAASGRVESADPGIALSEMASLIHGSEKLEELVRKEESFASLKRAVGDMPESAELLSRWDDFMERHGHHGRGEFELANIRWSDDPDYVLSLVKGYLERIEGDDALALYRKRGSERRKLVEDCRSRLRNPLKRKIFDLLLGKAAHGLSLRERYKSEVIRQIAFMRMLCRALGRNLAGRGVLDSADDIFFLEAGELRAVESGNALFDVKGTVAGRRSEYDRNRELKPYPVIVDSDGRMSRIPYDICDSDVMTGLGVSPGAASGPARVITPGDEDIRILPGEILVIPYADPGWSPYFFASAGIVIDMGGMLSHASIIAREYGIPTVVNVGPATEIIRTGQLVEVDGDLGIVTIRGKGGRETG